MPDQNYGIKAPLSGPYTNAAAVTPDDTNPLPFYALALWIGGAGTLTVLLRNATTPVTLTVVATTDNKPLKLYVKQVFATGTTATGLVALW